MVGSVKCGRGEASRWRCRSDTGEQRKRMGRMNLRPAAQLRERLGPTDAELRCRVPRQAEMAPPWLLALEKHDLIKNKVYGLLDLLIELVI